MTDQKKDALEEFLGSYQTMRKYQKKFFSGDKASLKIAIYWENQTDNYAKKMEDDLGLKVSASKGQATQGEML